MGKEKIDNKLYSIYYNRLSYILKGYDKKSKVEDVVHMKKEIEPYKLEKEKELLACIKITEAYMEKDFEIDAMAAGLDVDELELMDPDERAEALEEAGLDPDDYDFY